MRVPQIESVPVATAMAWLCGWYSHLWGLNNVNEILPGRISLGNLAIAWDRESLLARNITHVLSVTQFGGATAWYPDDFTYLCVDAQDEAGVSIGDHFSECIQFLEDALGDPNAHVLVHCNQGRSRSVTILAAFLMSQFGWPADETVRFIKSCRAEACPNPGFVEQLVSFEQQQHPASIGLPEPFVVTTKEQ